MRLLKSDILLKILLAITINNYSQSITNITPNKSEDSRVNKLIFHDNLVKRSIKTTFNNTGIVDSVITKKTNGNNEKKYSYEYDENGNLIFYLIQKWKDMNWLNSWTEIYNYDGNSNLVFHLIQEWSGSNWVNSWKRTFEHNSEGQLLSEIKARWINGVWENNVQIINEYMTDENIAVKYYYYWNSSEWIHASRLRYTYDINGNMLSEIEDHWNGENWVFSSGDLYYMWSYNENGKIISDSMKYWDESNWYYHHTNVYSYNSNGNLIIELYKLYEEQNFVDYRLGSYTYGNNDNLISGLFELRENEQWINYRNTTYTYNLDRNISWGKSEEWNGSEWVNGYYYLEFFDLAGRFYSFNTSEISVFYKRITDLENTLYQNNLFKLKQNYPNPFNPITTISYSLPKRGFLRLKIYDTLGKEMASLVNKEQASGNYKVEFDASTLPSGIYFYSLQSNKFKETKKMILLK